MQMIDSLSINFIGNTICLKCNCYCENLVVHCIHDCACVEADRFELWSNIHQLNVKLYSVLTSLNKENQVLIFLGKISDHICVLLRDQVTQFFSRSVYPACTEFGANIDT